MPQNKQEHLVSLITQYSVGSAFVFEPDEFRKGQATREPADLVWHCNECTVLIYMRYYQSSKGIQKNKNKSLKCIKHNLDQARKSNGVRPYKSNRSNGSNGVRPYILHTSTSLTDCSFKVRLLAPHFFLQPKK